MPCRPVALNTFFWHFSRNCFFPLFEILKLSLLKLSVQPRLVSNLHCLPSAPSAQGFIKHGPAHLAPATVPSWLLSSGFPAVDFSPQPRDETTLSTSWRGGSFSQWQTLSACGLLKRVFISSSVLKAMLFHCTIRVDFLLFLLQDFPEWSLVFGQEASLSSYASFIQVEPLSGLVGYARLVSTSPAVWLCCM